MTNEELQAENEALKMAVKSLLPFANRVNQLFPNPPPGEDSTGRIIAEAKKLVGL